MVARRIMEPPIRVMGVGMSCRRRTPKRIPQTGSRLARRLADWAVMERMLAMKRVCARAVQTPPRMRRMRSSWRVQSEDEGVRNSAGRRTRAAIPSW